MARVTKNFKLSEFERSYEATRRGIDNSVPLHLMSNLVTLAEWLQALRDALSAHFEEDTPVDISSGYRCPKLNKAVRGRRNSQHTQALAADISVDGLTPEELLRFILDSDLPPFDQLINEYDEWVHVSVAAVCRGEVLNAFTVQDANGKLVTQYVRIS